MKSIYDCLDIASKLAMDTQVYYKFSILYQTYREENDILTSLNMAMKDVGLFDEYEKLISN